MNKINEICRFGPEEKAQRSCQEIGDVALLIDLLSAHQLF